MDDELREHETCFGSCHATRISSISSLYETMESVTDRCEAALNVIEGTTLKMA